MLRSGQQTRPSPVSAAAPGPEPLAGVWHLDATRSRVEFRVPYYWGLGTIKTRFSRCAATLGLDREPWLELRVDATSLDSGSARRDRHLRSPAFFGVDEHPEVRFEAVTTRLEDGALCAEGMLSAGGGRTEIEIEGRVREAGGEYELTAEAFVMHRWLGMTWSPLGMTRPYSKLVVAGPLVRDDEPEPIPAAEPAQPGAPAVPGVRGAPARQAARRTRRGAATGRRRCAPSGNDGGAA
jgi:polyisoprenoid-binding protein YceI